MSDPYTTLGVSSASSDEEIRQAYRALARRWHPDRFPEGPERMWAEQKMIEINVAYRDALQHVASDAAAPEDAQFADVRRLIEIGQLSAARQALMRIAVRTAEWNYLFGAVLLRLGELEKAVLYFGIAARQRPESVQYRTAFRSAEAMQNQKRSPISRIGHAIQSRLRAAK